VVEFLGLAVEVDVEVVFDLLTEEFFLLVVAHGLDHVVLDFVQVQGAAVVFVQLGEHGACPELEHGLFVLEQGGELVGVQVAQEGCVAGHPVQAVGRTAGAHDQHGHDDSDETAQDDAHGVAPNGGGVDPTEVHDHHAAEGAHEGSDGVRVGVALACEDVGVVGGGQHHEPLVQEGGPEKQAAVVDEAEHDHAEEAHHQRHDGEVVAVELDVEGRSGAHLLPLDLPGDHPESDEHDEGHGGQLLGPREPGVGLLRVHLLHDAEQDHQHDHQHHYRGHHRIFLLWRLLPVIVLDSSITV